MNKVILFAVVGVVGGTIIGSGVSGAIARKSHVAAVDATKAAAPVEIPPPNPGTAAVVVPDTTAPAAVTAAAQPPAVLDTATAPIIRASIDTKVVDTLAQRAGRLAKLFTAMPARNAAKVLTQLEDEDVQRIIARVPDRQAAAILSNFPPERAAAVTRLTLGKATP